MDMLKYMLPKIWQNRAGIAEGIKNSIFKKKDIEELAEYRMNICKDCVWYSDNIKDVEYEDLPPVIKKIRTKDFINDSKKRSDLHCAHCTCALERKVRCTKCACPLMKWEAVATEEQEKDIKKLIGDEDVL